MDENVAAPRAVSIDDETGIVHTCRVALSRDHKAIHCAGRYEKLRRTQVRASEVELLMPWRHQPQDFLGGLHERGYVSVHLVDREGNEGQPQ